jgi:hypothetical protein
MPVEGNCTGRQFPLFSIDGFISIMYDNPVFVKRLFSLIHTKECENAYEKQKHHTN